MTCKDRGTEDVELARKPGEGRKTGKGQHEERHGCSEKGAFESQSGKITIVFPRAVLVRQTGEHGKGPDGHKCIGYQIKQQRRSSPLLSRSEEHTSELQSLRHLVCHL